MQFARQANVISADNPAFSRAGSGRDRTSAIAASRPSVGSRPGRSRRLSGSTWPRSGSRRAR